MNRIGKVSRRAGFFLYEKADSRNGISPAL